MTVTLGSPLVTCRYCPARCVQPTFPAKDRRYLVDPQPVRDGNLHLSRRDGMLFAYVVPAEKRAEHEELYRLHSATCPGRDERGRRRGRRGGRR